MNPAIADLMHNHPHDFTVIVVVAILAYAAIMYFFMK